MANPTGRGGIVYRWYISQGERARLTQLSVPTRKVAEVNVWLGCDSVSTPLHYDAMHNSYLQAYPSIPSPARYNYVLPAR